MALGGYKFAGYKSTKGSMTTAEWCLQIHKTRLKAFMAANALSGAGWSFDQTDGNITFETYGNVIYAIDEVGYNYVSFLRHGDAGFLALCSFFQYSPTPSYASGTINIEPILKVDGSTIVGMENTLFQRISKTQLNISNILTFFIRSTTLTPVSRIGAQSSRTVNAGDTGTYSVADVYYGGFAIKNGNLIEFNGSSPTYINIFVSSIGGIKNTLNDDKNDIITFNFTINTSHTVYETGAIYATTPSNDSPMLYRYGIQTSQKNGYTGNGNVAPTPKALYSGDIQTYPYEGLSVFLQSASEDGLRIKGVVDVDFIAINSPMNTSEIPANSKVVANGNYLTVHGWFGLIVSGLTAKPNMYPVIYVGWDPDNPQNIKDDSAWAEYNG